MAQINKQKSRLRLVLVAAVALGCTSTTVGGMLEVFAVQQQAAERALA